MLKNLIIIACMLAIADSRSTEVQWQAVHGSGPVWMLEQNEYQGSGINLMTSGDYSGCIIEREIPEPGESIATRVANRPAPGIIRTIITIWSDGSGNLFSASIKG